MPEYAIVTFRGKQMRVTYGPSPRAFCRPSPSAEVEWRFADLTAREREQLYVTPREEVAILRQIRSRSATQNQSDGSRCSGAAAGTFAVASTIFSDHHRSWPEGG
jgi:hypothetical protein